MRMNTKRDLEFLYELGCLRFIDRCWRQFIQDDVANLSEHTFRVAWLAMMIAKNEEVEDLGKIAKLALVHDIAESRTGDAHYVSRLYVDRNEELGIKDMLKDTTLEEEFVELWKEANEKKTKEAQCVKDADTLDVDLELREFWMKGSKLGDQDHWAKHRKDAVKGRLYTKTADAMWESIIKSDPSDWHLNARNRFSDGDWKDKTK